MEVQVFEWDKSNPSSVVHIGNRIVFGVNQRILDLLKIGGTHYFRGFGDVAAIIDFGENIGFRQQSC